MAFGHKQGFDSSIFETTVDDMERRLVGCIGRDCVRKIHVEQQIRSHNATLSFV